MTTSGTEWHWRDDHWLAARMGMPVLELCPAPPLPPPPLSLWTPAMREAFIFTRIDVQHAALVAPLCDMGFTLTDTAVTLERRGLPPLPFCPPGIHLRLARPEDKEGVTALARNAYSLTRFHQDAQIHTDLANTIQACWAANFFQGQRGDLMLVGVKDGQIAGFHLALTPDAHTMVVDLIAVAPQAQGIGLGRALIDTAQRLSQCPVARTGTQLANTASLAFYQKMGFVFGKAAHTLHRHPQGRESRQRFYPVTPPRVYEVGFEHKTTISDCGRVQLAPDEQITLVTPNGGQYDVTRKDWGFYATPSTNGRLASFGLRTVLVCNSQNKYFVLLVEKGREDRMRAYLEQECMDVLCWLDNDEGVESLVGRASSPP